jgi:hypothetical protein
MAERDDVQVLSLTERAYEPDEAFTRTPLLLEEAALEAARRVLGPAS